MNSKKHKVFVSYHHENDQKYREKFEALFSDKHDILVSKSVQLGDINPNQKTENIRRIIRDDYLADSSVLVVLIGKETWKRKFVDWEISSAIRDTKNNSRMGLIGILLPDFPIKDNKYNPYTIPPRLAKNIDNGYAKIYHWSSDPSVVKSRIHEAFSRRKKIIPDNSFAHFVNNRTGSRWTN